jgi:predicted ester cyclase
MGQTGVEIDLDDVMLCNRCINMSFQNKPGRMILSIMSTPNLVASFYERIWNAGDFSAIEELLAEDFAFRSSLGTEMRGRKAFEDYARSVRGGLTNYLCQILDCITEEDRAFAKMRFSGLHTSLFRGWHPTGKPVHWLGAALFRFERSTITDLWVLGDLIGLDTLLKSNLQCV